MLVDLANHLYSRGHTVSVLTFDPPNLTPFYKLDSNVQVHMAGVGSPGEPTPRIRFIQSILGLRRLVRFMSPDLIVAFMHSTYVPMRFATVGLRVKFLCSEHVGAAHFTNRKTQRWLSLAAIVCSEGATVPNPEIREEFPAAIRSRITVLKNPQNLTQFLSVRDVQPSEPKQILVVGRFMEEKNHKELLRAFVNVHASYPSWMVRLVGTGELADELRSLVESLGISDSVVFDGVRSDVAAAYADASLVAVPSLHESYALVAAEALAAGRPVVGFDNCIGLKAMIDHGANGLLVSGSGNRVESLVEGLVQVMTDQRYLDRCRATAQESARRLGDPSIFDQWEARLVAAGRA